VSSGTAVPGSRGSTNTQTYVAAVDLGTTSTRCLIYDHLGRMVSVAQRAHHQYYPHPGWVEHDATEVWGLVGRVLEHALEDAELQPSDLAALGVTGQRETTVLWDKLTGVPVHRAIVWQDTRTDALLDELADAVDAEDVSRRTGLPMASYFSAPKIRWLLDHDPELQRRAEAGTVLFGTMDSWLMWNLTGGPSGGRHVTDVTNASRTMLMNLESLDWDPTLLERFRIPRPMLPEIRPSIDDFGVTKVIAPGVPIGAVIGDQQASLFGQTAFCAGQAKCTFGTGTFLLLNTGTEITRSTHGLITTVAYQALGKPAVYALEGAISTTGALVSWCRDSLKLIRSPAEIETLAAAVDDNGGCYIVPAFSGLLAPHWDPGAQGVIVGLTAYVQKEHIARAALESTAWQTRDVVDAMNADAQLPASSLAVDGGMTADNLLMQMLADALDVPVVRPMMAETVALGAAYAAGLSVGYWDDLDTLRSQWRRAAEWVPTMSSEWREREHRHWRLAVRLAALWGRRDQPGELPC
jgi:glycerol kinase